MKDHPKSRSARTDGWALGGFEELAKMSSKLGWSLKPGVVIQTWGGQESGLAATNWGGLIVQKKKKKKSIKKKNLGWLLPPKLL